MTKATFAAVAEIFFKKKPANIIDAIGIKKIPLSCCKSWYNPSGAFATIGATKMANTARTVDVSFPILTNFLSLLFSPKCLLKTSILNMVAALFNTLLKVLNTAPIIIAANTPTKPIGSTFFTNSGYIIS